MLRQTLIALLAAMALHTGAAQQIMGSQKMTALHMNESDQTIGGWQMQDVAKVAAPGPLVSSSKFKPANWYRATVPGTVLTTLVDNKVYPEPLYGENMRAIPESLNKTSYWYRTEIKVPAANKGRHTWLHFAGINYGAEIWVNGRQAGTMRGAFRRGDFDITPLVTPGRTAIVAVLVAPQPHPGIPIEHNVANGIGKNGGITALDGPTFLSTIGWDWLVAIRDRDTGIFLPVTLDSTGPARLLDPFIRSELTADHGSADLTLTTDIQNLQQAATSGEIIGTITGPDGKEISFRKPVTLAPGETQPLTLDGKTTPELHLTNPQLWWPNGYGPQNLYRLRLRFVEGKGQRISHEQQLGFGIRKIEYSVPDSENLTISVNGVRVMARGGNWGLDEAMKRTPRERLDAQFHMHALAHMNFIRNWVGQSTSPDFYELADKYGILLWDEFFQPNPFDGPDPDDVPNYLSNVEDKVRRYRNHPSIAVWCARNEGYPPKALDDQLKSMMTKLDGSRLYQSNSADGRGVSSHGPYYWRSPRFFYALNESFKTETGSVSVPTIESIQGMLPKQDWESINDDWAQHDMARGAQRGDEYPQTLAHRYGPIRNLADFVRKAQLANYEAFRAMYESRNAEMFQTTTGIFTWMSHPAQPSFVWQLYHYDLEPNSSLYAVQKASEQVHIQLNEAKRGIEVVNNRPDTLTGLHATVSIYDFSGKLTATHTSPLPAIPPSRTVKIEQIDVGARITPLYFVKLDLQDGTGHPLSTNFYWQHVSQDEFAGLSALPRVALTATATQRAEADRTLYDITLTNPAETVALMAHLQLHDRQSGHRVLPAFASDNYISLVPGEVRKLTIEIATNIAPASPEIQVDGYNVDVNGSGSTVPIILNKNAQPENSPASSIVPSHLN